MPLVESGAMAVAECWLRALRVRCMVVANVDKARGTACREASPRGCEEWRQRGAAAEMKRWKYW